MSIQLTLSGHSFSRSDLPKLSSNDQHTIEIEVITNKTLLAPFELIDETRAEKLMDIAGFGLLEDEQVIIVPDKESGIAALMALPRVLIATIEECYGNRFELTTPLLHTRVCIEPTAWFYLANDLIYIKVWSDNRLRIAEVLPRKNAEDVLYSAATIDKRFRLNGFRIVVAGTKAVESEIRSTAKILNQYYKKVICE